MSLSPIATAFEGCLDIVEPECIEDMECPEIAVPPMRAACVESACTVLTGSDALPLEEACPHGTVGPETPVPDQYLACASDDECVVVDVSPDCSCCPGGVTFNGAFKRCFPVKKVDCSTVSDDCAEGDCDTPTPKCVKKKKKKKGKAGPGRCKL